MSGVSLSSRAQPTWSEVTWSTRPASSRRQSASCCARGRSGGLILARPPRPAQIVLVHHEVVRARLGGRVDAVAERVADEREAALDRDVAEVRAAAGREAELERARRSPRSRPRAGGRRHAPSGRCAPRAASFSDRRRTMSSFSGWKQTSAPSPAQISIASSSSPSGTRGKRTGCVSNVETLKAAAPGGVQRRDLVQPAARRDRRVERDVDDRLGLDVRGLLLEARERVDGLGVVVGHVDDRRHAARGGRRRGARDALARRAAGVHVRVDVAGQDELPGGDVDALLPAQLAGLGEHRDAPVRDADLAVGDLPSGERKTAADDKIQHCGVYRAPQRGGSRRELAARDRPDRHRAPERVRAAGRRAGARACSGASRRPRGRPVEVVPYLEARDLSQRARRSCSRARRRPGRRTTRPRSTASARSSSASGRPVLGICAGMQLLGRFAGGRIDHAAEPEIGELEVDVIERDGLFRDVGERPRVWQYHTDELTDRPGGLPGARARRARCRVQAIASEERGWWGTQFHPESYRSANPDGARILRTFFELAAGAMNLDEVDGRFGEAWAGTSPDGSHINVVIGRRGSPTAAAAAAAMADVEPGPHAVPALPGRRQPRAARDRRAQQDDDRQRAPRAADLGRGAARHRPGRVRRRRRGPDPARARRRPRAADRRLRRSGGRRPHRAARGEPPARRANAIADALQTDHRERTGELIAERETLRNRFYRGD